MKKCVKNLMTTSIVFVVLAVALFIIWPLVLTAITNNGGAVEGALVSNIQSFLTGASGIETSDNLLLDIFKATFASFPKIFDFGTFNLFSLISLIVFVVTVLLWVVWLIVIIARKKSPSVGALIVSLFTNSLAFVVVHALYFMCEPISGTALGTNMLTTFFVVFATYSEGFPIYALIMVIASLAFASIAYILTLIEFIIDICSKRVNKYVEASPLDEVVNKEDLTSVDELRKLLKEEVAPAPVEEKTVQQAPAAPQAVVVPSQGQAQPFIFQQFFGGVGTPAVQQNIPTAPAAPTPEKEVVKPSEPTLKEEDIRKIIHEEVASSVADAVLKETLHGELPTGHGNEIRAIVKEEVDKTVTSLKEEIRKIVREELDEVTVKALPAYEPQPQIIKEIIREVPVVVKEEKKVEEVKEPEPVKEEPVVTPEPEPEPVAEEPVVTQEPVVEETIVEETTPLVEKEVTPEPEPEPVEEDAPVEEKAKIIRVPFTDRVRIMDPTMRANFNELKSDIMAYGVKSRVSNSGDTFRLHTKTYVKITIAGKSLKLYFALNPEDYKDSTLPIADAGHKGIYKDIPLVFKVKSDLSLRRAKQLVADAMAKDNLVQDEVVAKDWIQEIIDTYPATGKLEAAGLVDSDEDEE